MVLILEESPAYLSSPFEVIRKVSMPRRPFGNLSIEAVPFWGLCFTDTQREITQFRNSECQI